MKDVETKILNKSNPQNVKSFLRNYHKYIKEQVEYIKVYKQYLENGKRSYSYINRERNR